VMAKRVTVFGSGSFGTAMAFCLAKNMHTVTILCRKGDVAESINKNHRNSRYFSEYVLPDNLTATTDPKEALSECNYILHAVPVQSSKEYLRNLKDLIPPHVPFINVSKGLESTSLMYMSCLIPKVLERPQPLAIISGPSFAKELLEQQPTAVVSASEDRELAIQVQLLFASPALRVYTSNDVVGVEIGGALKNVFAIAAGVAEGLGLGMNSRAGLVTRGCAEMKRVALAMGAKPETLSGLTGIGDLMLTCFGTLSRNRTVGVRLGKGETLEQIMSTFNEVAEGVATTRAAVKLVHQYKLHAPIILTVNEILDGAISCAEAISKLMNLPLTAED